MPFSRFWDISMPVKEGMMIWPGDTKFTRNVRTKLVGEQQWSNSEIQMGAHTGTHMDAPCHVFQKGGDVHHTLFGDIGPCAVLYGTL